MPDDDRKEQVDHGPVRATSDRLPEGSTPSPSPVDIQPALERQAERDAAQLTEDDVDRFIVRVRARAQPAINTGSLPGSVALGNAIRDINRAEDLGIIRQSGTLVGLLGRADPPAAEERVRETTAPAYAAALREYSEALARRDEIRNAEHAAESMFGGERVRRPYSSEADPERIREAPMREMAIRDSRQIGMSGSMSGRRCGS